MKLIHCADLHLDARMNTHFDRDKARERRAELLRTFERMVAFGASQHVEGILIAGDLFDTRQVSATARHVVLDTIRKHPEISFFYLIGNHDHGNFIRDLSEMEDWSEDREDSLPANLFLFGEQWTSYELGMAGNVVLTGMELTAANAGMASNRLVLDAGKINLVTLHGQETERDGGDQAEVIDLRSLRNKHIDYLALGHVHFYKEGKLDARGIYCYPGCLEGRGFDECGVHGFVLLDIQEETGQIRRTFYNGGGRRIYEIPVDVTGCQYPSQMLHLVQQTLSDAGCDARSLVKVRLTGNLDVECDKDLTYIYKALEGEYYLIKIEDATTLHVQMEDYRWDKTLKGAFVRLVMERDDLSEEEKAQIIRYGTQAIIGEEIDS